MRVTNVRTMRLLGPRSHMPGGGEGRIGKLIVRVDTDSGIYGLGECEDFAGVREAIAYIRACLLDRSPFDIRPFVSEMMYGTLPPHTAEQMCDVSRFAETRPPVLVCSPTAIPTGPVVWAISGVEMALCDLAGKALNTPTYNLLGGKYRDKVKVYVDRSSPDDQDDLDAWRAMGLEAVEEGFTQLKFDAAYTAPACTGDVWNRSIGTGQMNRIVERIGAAREAVGWDVDICVDCHRLYNVTDATILAERLSDLRIKWLEDPTPAHNLQAAVSVRQKSRVPICIGEMYIAEEARSAIDAGACDIIHPDILFAGGLHEMRRIADYAEINAMPMAMHGNGGCLATIAAAHAAASIRNFLGLEYHHIETEWVANYVVREGLPLFSNGHVPLSDAPGLGVELDEEVCRQVLAPGESVFDS